LIVLFDEVDVLVDETMISFLRQLHGGFASRGVGNFPVSIALVGMRDLKGYLSVEVLPLMSGIALRQHLEEKIILWGKNHLHRKQSKKTKYGFMRSPEQDKEQITPILEAIENM
jgi:hypothetical protein